MDMDPSNYHLSGPTRPFWCPDEGGTENDITFMEKLFLLAEPRQRGDGSGSVSEMVFIKA